ncbi:cohesin subunit SA-2 isoform X3 [Planococcus citri]
MHRSIGKRISMDDPPPEEYENMVNNMTPAYAPEVQERYSPFMPYGNPDPNIDPSAGMYTDTYGNAQTDHYGHPNQYNPPPQYGQADQFISSPLPQMAPLQDQEMLLHDAPQDTGLFHMPTDNQMQFQEEHIPTANIDESLVSQHIPQMVNEPMQQDQPETPGNVRITRSRLRGGNTVTQQPQPTPSTSTLSYSRKAPEERRGRPGRPPAVRKQTVDEESSASPKDSCLYDLIRNGKSSLTTLVDDWIDEYKVNRDTALLALMQFFINASGCKGKITSMMAANMEHAAIIRKMTEEFDEESGEYPLIMSGPQWKKFRQNFCDFVAILVKQCQYSIIYDQYLMDNVISLLTGLSDSQVRAFRHTATLAAMKLMTALVDVALTVSINLDNTQRQYEAERQKGREKRASDRLESLMSKRQELEENMDEIKNMLTYLFKSVFVHRYRDTLPEIRAICMAEIGVWMKKFHQNFLDDSYLKYIGWTLHDKVGEVRLKCLQALQPLYASEELKGKLELFTSKFKDRIVAMTLDKEYEVAVQAVKLVISILKHHKDILTDKDCEHVYELVYSSHRAVAQAAGEFLNERLFVQDEMMQGTRTKRGKKRLANTPLIRDLVQFFIESELHEHGAYLVDSLIESNDMMKDWECMTDLLLEEPGPSEEALDDRQETSLIELMTCCVRQAATGEAPVGRGSNRKIASVKEIKQVQEDKAKLTEHFTKTLPLLLDKYRADADKLVNLLSFPQYFELEMYVKSRQETNLELLLKKMQLIADKHQNTDVLETCAKTLEVLCNESNAIICTKCDVQRSTLIDNIVKKYREAMDDWNAVIESNEEPDDDETFQVVTSLKKISIFYACHNLGHWNIWLVVFNDFRNAISGQKYLPDEAIKSSVWACYYGTMWDLHHLEDLAETGGGANIENLVREVKSRLSQLMETYKEMLLHQSLTFREEAYVAICDLLIVFCNQLGTNPYKVLSELIYEPDKELQKMLNDFIQGNVFVYEEEEENDDHSRIEALHKRRNFLASYCKLIVYGIMPTACASDVFKHYVKSYNEYGDIIKATVAKARELNKVNCARTMVASLISLFRELHDENGGLIISRNSNQFASLKELAKRFALSFGLDALKNREAIAALHREGVLFAVSEPSDDPTSAPPNLPFLEILMEFTNKLLKQDKRMILNYLDRRISSGMPSSKGEDWQPLLLYRNSLLHGESDQPLPTARRAYTRKKKEVDDENGEDEDQISDQEYG